MVDPAYVEAVRTIRDAVAGDVTWALTGSTSFALQGVPVEPNDVDVQTDEAGAYALERRLSRVAGAEVLEPVSFRTGDGIRSHFGALAVGDVRVEVMGAVQKRVDGEWEPPVDAAERREWIAVGGTGAGVAEPVRVPVLPLSYEARAYERLGRNERAATLRAYAGDGDAGGDDDRGGAGSTADR